MALKNIVALAGGVGGAKLAHGLARALPAGALTVVVNIGDDFQHYGLHISPDLDTVTYTLAEINNQETGWGLANESWQMLEMMKRYDDPAWFRLGDQDIATHILRTDWLKQGETLTRVVQRFTQALHIQQKILPVSNNRCATMLDTLEMDTLPFQEYFVLHRWQPTVKRVWYDGIALPTDEVLTAFETAEAFIICPSNPILSVDPILAIGDLRQRLENRTVPCVAVSPLIHGKAVKGPAEKIMTELGYVPSTDGLMQYYEGLIDLLVVDHGDAPEQGMYLEKNIMMNSIEDRERLAHDILTWLGGVQ